NEEKPLAPARGVGAQWVRELAPPAVANPAPVFSGRAAVDPGQVNDGTRVPDSGVLQPPRLVYRDDEKVGRPEAGAGNESGRSSTGGPSELSAEEKLRLAAFRQDQEGLAAPTPVRGAR